ncbi:ribosomal protein S5 domain 2-type protein [Globomyces pollinis-pini]|nr:ribosomal protein S5 domain 2-type protein [Globomyces pollinis-pini]
MTKVLTQVSAPGKVLLTGGYLVLDQRFRGLVVSVDARFQVKITDVNNSDGKWIVESPQFTNGSWSYKVSEDGIESLGDRNKFVEITLRLVLQYLVSSGLKGLESLPDIKIEILGDNDFYSQAEYLQFNSLPSTLKSLSIIPKFNSVGCTLSAVHKTGLGSSAAMVASLVFALLTHFNSKSAAVNFDTYQAERLAQVCHCVAQGKIGSGFDISAAVHGTHSYRRFNPSIIKDALERNHSDAKFLFLEHDLTLFKSIQSNWDSEHLTFNLPDAFVLQLGDVNFGSNTPSMVSKVLAWRSENKDECERIWNQLNEFNESVTECFQLLNKIHATDHSYYSEMISMVASQTYTQWVEETSNIHVLIVKLHDTFVNIRKLLRELGNRTDVPIEPEEQRELLDACMQQPGVVMAGVPGAGGYDALFCICIGETSRTALIDFWNKSSWKITPLLCSQSQYGIKIESEVNKL